MSAAEYRSFGWVSEHPGQGGDGKLTFVVEKPPTSRVLTEVALMAAEENANYLLSSEFMVMCDGALSIIALREEIE